MCIHLSFKFLLEKKDECVQMNLLQLLASLKQDKSREVVYMTKTKLSDHELLELYQQGLINKEIADRMGVAQSSVHYRLEKLGLKNNCHQREFV
jgi:DNA-binding NarL/FixJ family response regulator